MSFGLTFDKLLIIAVIAVFLIGPDRLPGYAAQLARLVRTLRDLANGAKDRMREEMGPEFDEVDWKKLDPRQYDPRRIIREALLNPSSPGASAPARPGAAHPPTGPRRAVPTASDGDAPPAGTAPARRRRTTAKPPFDPEST